VSAETHDPRVAIQDELGRASNYNNWIAARARAHLGRRILDAGCGSGNITRLMMDRDHVAAVDVWPDFVEHMKADFGDRPDVSVHQFDLADPAMVEALAPLELDSAMCLNVLEHVEDHRTALRNFAEIVGPGGSIFLLVPAFMSLYGEHDRADHHFRRYTKQSLAQTVDGLPLRIERQHYMNLPGYFAWFLVCRLLRRQLSSESIGFYDKLIPAIRGVETRVKPPFGQTLVALMRAT
jgi:SAM-dependent methyltransferase